MVSTRTITGWTGMELSRPIHARELCCREVMQADLARIDRLDGASSAIAPMVGCLPAHSGMLFAFLQTSDRVLAARFASELQA